MTYQRKGPHVLPYGDPLVFPCGHERTEANSLANGRGKPPRCKTCKLKSHWLKRQREAV